MNKHLRIPMVLLTLFVFVTVMFGFGGNVAYANTSGVCGENVYWSFDRNNGVLTISGQGSMLDCAYVYNSDRDVYIASSPWKIYSSKITKVVVKEGVTYIGAYSFIDCGKLTSVELPNSLKKIGKSAFSKTRLQYVKIPNSVNVLGDNVFFNCYSLKEVEIGSGMQSIGAFCFSYTDLEVINYNGSEESWNQIMKSNGWNGGDTYGKIKYVFSDWSFDDNTGTLTVGGLGDMTDYAYSAGGSITAPWGDVKDEIKTVIIKEGVTSIGDYAFFECENLVDVQYPESLQKIGRYAFSYCDNYEDVKFPDNLQEIEEGAFSYCKYLSDIEFPKNLIKIGDSAFSNCKKITDIELPENLKEIGRLAFSSTGIRDLEIPNSVITIGESAFAGCFSLEEVEIGTGVKMLSDYCFSNCDLKKVYYNGTMAQWNQVTKSNTWNSGVNKDKLIINYIKNGVMTDYTHYDPNIINVIVDGNYMNFDTKPQFVNGRTMVPMRRIFEELGAAVQWDNATWTAIARKDGIEIKFTIDDYTMYKNGNANTLDVPAQLIDGRTLVPLRAVSEAFGCDVGWDGQDNVVSIISDKQNYTMLYTQDGRSRCYSKSEAYGQSGWYNEPSVLLYNCKGSQYFLQSQAEAQVKAGWSYTYVNGHDWKGATCTAPKTCRRCGETSGGKSAHLYNKKTGKCDYCSTNMDDGGMSAFPG